MSDGYLNIGVTNQKQWSAFCRVLGLLELETDPRFVTTTERLAHYDALKKIITPRLATMSRREAMAALSKAEIAVGPVNTLAEVLEDPHIHAREMIHELTHPEYGPIRQLGIPLKMSDTPGAVEGPPPVFGEHNEEILGMLGYLPERIKEWMKLGIIVREGKKEIGNRTSPAT
jgi:crotonobetainyl-CoA:carnitine CoA-transferase CaiB-like acyl-CoA transferase